MTNYDVINQYELSSTAHNIAVSGDTITLTDNIKLSSQIKLSAVSGITFSGNNYYMSSTSDSISFIFYLYDDSGYNTIKDIDFIGYNANYRSAIRSYGIHTHINNCTFRKCDYGINIQGQYITISGCTFTDNSSFRVGTWPGVSISDDDSIIEYCTFSGLSQGIDLVTGSDDNTISNCTFYRCGIASKAHAADNNIFSSNTFEECNYGIKESELCYTNEICYNTFKNCGKCIIFTNYPNTGGPNIHHNYLYHPIQGYEISGLSISNIVPSVNSTISYSFRTRKPDLKMEENPDWKVYSYPDTDTFSYSGQNGSLISGNLTLDRYGTHSLFLEFTDSSSNRIIRKYSIFVSAQSNSGNMYLNTGRTTLGGHYGTDAFRLTEDPPTDDGDLTCGTYVIAFNSSVPDLNLCVFSGCYNKIIYKVGDDGDAGFKRVSTYANGRDISFPVADTSDVITKYEYYLGGINWSMDYPHSWNFLSWVYKADSIASPHVYISGSYLASSTSFIYSSQHTSHPKIEYLSNKNIYILSATSPTTDDTESLIEISGEGIANIRFQMPDTTETYTVNWNDEEAESYTQNNGLIVVSSLNLVGYGHLDVTLGEEEEESVYYLNIYGPGRLKFYGGNKSLSIYEDV